MLRAGLDPPIMASLLSRRERLDICGRLGYNRARVDEAYFEFQRMLNEDKLRDTFSLVLANKQDIPNAMSAVEITGKLGLHALDHDRYIVQECSATTGNGLYEGLDGLFYSRYNHSRRKRALAVE